jgi:ABC-type molybdate transport system substrate-binding protein
VLTAGAFKPVLLAVQPQFEQQTGHRLLIQNDTAGGLQKRVLEGEAFDVVISSPASLKAMREAGKVTRDEPPILARVAIGVAVRADAAVPQVRLVGALPKDIQNYTVYAAAASTQAQGAVGELLTFLRSPQWTSVLLDKGMEP